MTDDTKTVSEMVRITVENNAEFMRQVADHIDKLETAVKELKDRIEELEALSGDHTETQ
jgi:ubiquinone biosynthesis protein UbiJ